LEQQVHAIRMDIITVAAPTVTAVMKKSHVIMVAAMTIPLVKMVTN
jgi:hypothetical protein